MIASLVVPVHNTPVSELEACRDSLYAQTLSRGDYEVVVVDDGSRDECADAIRGMFDGCRIIRLEENHGVSHARNVGIDASSGDYVSFVDADDEVAPFYLEEALGFASERGADLVIGMLALTAPDGPFDWGGLSAGAARVFSGDGGAELLMAGTVCGDDFLLRDVAQTGALVHSGPCSRLYSRSLIGRRRFDERFSVGEDMLFNLDCLGSRPTVCVTGRCWYRYKMNAYSATHAFGLAEVEDRLRQLDRLLEVCGGKGELVRQAAFGRCVATTKPMMESLLSGSGGLAPDEAGRAFRMVLGSGAVQAALAGIDGARFDLAPQDRAYLALLRGERTWALKTMMRAKGTLRRLGARRWGR